MQYDLLTHEGRNAVNHEREQTATIARLTIGSVVEYRAVARGPVTLTGILLDVNPETLTATVEVDNGRDYIDARLLTVCRPTRGR